MPPEDPTLYRFVEMIKVYGYPLKAIIYEKVRVNLLYCYEYWLSKMPLHIKFGDGIMSAIDFKAHVDKVVIWIHLHKDEKRLLTLYLGWGSKGWSSKDHIGW